jgi:hypothetical protein
VDLFLVALEEDERAEGGMAKGGRGAPGPRAPTLTIPRRAGFNLLTRFSRGAEAEEAGPCFSSEGLSKKTVDRFAIPEVGAAGGAAVAVLGSGAGAFVGVMTFVVARRDSCED